MLVSTCNMSLNKTGMLAVVTLSVMPASVGAELVTVAALAGLHYIK